MKRYLIENHTPHTLNVLDARGREIAVFPSVGNARVTFADIGEETISVDGKKIAVALGRRAVGTTDVPSPVKDTLFVVSSLVKSAFPDRRDLVVPDSLVRDDQGRIIGCRRFSR